MIRWISPSSSSWLSVVGSTGDWSRPELAHHVVDVGVGRERPEVTEGRDLTRDVAHGARQHETQEGAALERGHAGGDPEVHAARCGRPG